MISQITWEDIGTDLLPQAVFGKPPAYFEEKWKIKFTPDSDGLDYYKGAFLALNNGLKFALKQYRGHNQKTTTIYLPANQQDVDHITKAIAEIVAALGLEAGDILWQRKDNPDA